MSSLGETHLRQGRSFLRSGDPRRAAELLEKARSLARGDTVLLREATAELASAYEQLGEHERASRCRAQLDSLGGMPSASQPMDTGFPVMSRTRHGRRKWPLWATASLIVVALALHVSLYLGYRSYMSRHEMAAAPPATPTTPPTISAPTLPSASPAVNSSGQTSPPPSATETRVAAVPEANTSAEANELGELIRQNVGLLIVLAHYEGKDAGRAVELDLPLGTGTAFAVNSSGVLLTNKHIIEGADEPSIPPTLEILGMPTVTLRKTSYLVCFGPDRNDHVNAKLAYKSEKFDVAVLTIDRRFESPLLLATGGTKQAQEILAAGYPGVIQDLLEPEYQSDASFVNAIKKFRANGSVDLVSELFGPEAFKSTVTRGIISTPERNRDGVGYTLFDAKVSAGNSGGPLLAADHRVLAIVTWGGVGVEHSGYNFALLLAQLRDELAQWVELK